ncbi:MAG: hypothetical protein P4L31_06210 [Candidatus Babeliales bacterium]|nr:hypothetical protein [Candidatus Babeliales bacterium]
MNNHTCIDIVECGNLPSKRFHFKTNHLTFFFANVSEFCCSTWRQLIIIAPLQRQ